MSTGIERQIGHHVPEQFPGALRGLAAVSRFVAVLEGVGIGVSLFALVGLALWQFTTRNLRMHGFPSVSAAPDWTDNVLRHSVFLIGFLGAMFASYSGRHLRVDAVTRLAGAKRRMALRVVATLGALAVCSAIIYAAWKYRTGVLDETVQEGQVFTAARGAMIIVVGAGGMMFHFLVQLVLDVGYLATGHEPPAWWIAEASHGGEAAPEGPQAEPVRTAADIPEAAP
jgi:TRAP-type C4-dicarboxylate transport system permease small subunit